MPSKTSLGSILLASALAIGFTACGGGDDTDTAAETPDAAVTKTVTDFFSALNSDGEKACALLSSAGKQEVVALFNRVAGSDGTGDCATAAGVRLGAAGALQDYNGQNFADSLRAASDQGKSESNLSVTVTGGTAEVSVNGVSDLWQSVTAKKYGQDWKVESFVAPDAL